MSDDDELGADRVYWIPHVEILIHSFMWDDDDIVCRMSNNFEHSLDC